MAQSVKEQVTVECEVRISAENAWASWNGVEHIAQWNLWPGWHVPRAENDLTVGGRFFYRMEEKSSGEGFDYSGSHDEIVPFNIIRSHLDDGRTIEVVFKAVENSFTTVIQTLEPKTTYSAEAQKQGWQEIMDCFKDYVEKA